MRVAFAVVFFAAVCGCSKPADVPAATLATPVADARPAHTPEKGEMPGEAEASKAGREQVDADGVVRRGAKLSDAAVLTVSEAAAKASELDGKNVKLTGKVESVCQPMGCWMVVAGDKGEKVRVTSKSHDVFLPKSSAGRIATVEGELKVKTLEKAMAQHYEDERELAPGEARKVITEDQQELSLSVSALELKPAA